MRVRVTTSTLIAALLTLAVGTSARASGPAPRQTRLVYVRGSGAGTCPSATGVQRAVEARLGYDPFDYRARQLIRLRVTSAGNAWRARLELLDEQGQLMGERELSSEVSCEELVATAALAIALAIDPDAAERPKPPPKRDFPRRARVGATRVFERRGIAPTPPVVEPPPPEVVWRLGASARAAAFVTTGPVGAGGALDVGFAVGAWSLSLELGVNGGLLEAASVAGAQVRTIDAAAALVPCYETEVVDGCLWLGAGVVVGGGEGVAAPETTVTPLAAGGARVQAHAAIADGLEFRAHLDVVFPFTRTSLLIGDEVAWTTPVAGAVLGVGIRAVWR